MSNENQKIKYKEVNKTLSTRTPNRETSLKYTGLEDSRTFCKTPLGKVNRTTLETSLAYSVLNASCVSRMDFASVPDLGLDIDACRAEIAHLEQEHRHLMQAERSLLRADWSRAKKNAKKDQENKAKQHDRYIARESFELNKALRKTQRDHLETVRQDKKNEFFDLKSVKKELEIQAKLRDEDRLSLNLDKSRKLRLSRQEQKEKIAKEQETKRNCFFESVEVQKSAQLNEKIRMEREKIFEISLDLSGKKKILENSCRYQKEILKITQELYN